MDSTYVQTRARLFPSSSDPVVELRRYTHHPGRRDDLISLFEREFVESQEECGCHVIAYFRDLDHPDTFTWFRGFESMSARRKALTNFYDGPVWRANRDAANSTLIDSDNVWLLRPAHGGSGIVTRPMDDATDARVQGEVVVVTIYTLTDAAADAFPNHFARSVAPVLATCGAKLAATYVTEQSRNDFPRLPVREGEHAFVVITTFGDVAQHSAQLVELEMSLEWQGRILPELQAMFSAPPVSWRLVPGERALSLRVR